MIEAFDMVCSTKRHSKVVRDTSGDYCAYLPRKHVLWCAMKDHCRRGGLEESHHFREESPFDGCVERWDKVTEDIPTETQGLLSNSGIHS